MPRIAAEGSTEIIIPKNGPTPEWLANAIANSIAQNPNAAGTQGSQYPQFTYYAGSPAAGGGGGGGSTPSSNPLDWRSWLENWGFPTDVTNELDRIFRSYTDPSAASAAALAYIRGTDWYAKTFPGINEGKKLGVVSDERSYRSYVNDLNQLYRRYYNRDITGQEVAQLLGQGKDQSIVNRELIGRGFINANRNDIQYLLGAFGEGRLTEDQLTALGQQQAGLDNMIGQDLQARLDKARQRLQRVFQGALATPSLSLATGRLSAPSLLGGTNTPDVGA